MTKLVTTKAGPATKYVNDNSLNYVIYNNYTVIYFFLLLKGKKYMIDLVKT